MCLPNTEDNLTGPSHVGRPTLGLSCCGSAHPGQGRELKGARPPPISKWGADALDTALRPIWESKEDSLGKEEGGKHTPESRLCPPARQASGLRAGSQPWALSFAWHHSGRGDGASFSHQKANVPSIICFSILGSEARGFGKPRSHSLHPHC